MNSYEYELIVDGKLLSRFWLNKYDGKDAKFIANALLNDKAYWKLMYRDHPNDGSTVWGKATVDGRNCYLEIVAIGIPNE